ncbi:MAG: GNAT family N-acetyltransferase [Bryobacteraceae bacterium]|jgi:GNAT superfamily N-acetyltransferase
MSIIIRRASLPDVPRLEALIDASVRGLQSSDYSPEQIDRALRSVYGVDTRLIEDRTYYAAETEDGGTLAGCGGWSKRKTLFGGDHYSSREDGLLDPTADPAKIRAFFVHPHWARRGIGSMILDACETAAIAAGFTRFELGATLTGVPFYRARGYKEIERIEAPLGDGVPLTVIRMEKSQPI